MYFQLDRIIMRNSLLEDFDDIPLMRLTKTTQMIAIVNATIGITTIPLAMKILRVCALHGFLTQDLSKPTSLSAQLSDCVSVSSKDALVDVSAFSEGVAVDISICATEIPLGASIVERDILVVGCSTKNRSHARVRHSNPENTT
jgi:hypothetical protein